MSNENSRVHRACVVCRHQVFTEIYYNRLGKIGGLDLSNRIGICAACGHAQAYELPEEELYSYYYRTYSKYDFSASIGAVDLQRIEFAVQMCHDLIKEGSAVADLGCGSGALLAALSGVGFKPVLGLDPAPNAARTARQIFGLEVVKTADLSEAPAMMENLKLDLICVMAVLEHLYDPLSTLKTLHQAIPDGASILIEVPALEGFNGGIGEPLGEFSLEHIQFFSAVTLNSLMIRSGFSVVASRKLKLKENVGTSLFGLYKKNFINEPTDFYIATHADAERSFRAYAEAGLLRTQNCLRRIPADRCWILYGAGSHSARLLPLLTLDQRTHLVMIVDGNPNLWGHPFGDFEVDKPEGIADFPDAVVVVSSYRGQAVILQRLQTQFNHKIIALYPELEALP